MEGEASLMCPSSQERLLIVGIGNELRGDDGLGRLVARELAKNVAPNITIMEQSGEGTALMRLWENWPNVLLIDALKSGSPPGTIHRLDPIREPLPRWFGLSSSHSFGIAEAIALSRHLNKLPRTLRIIGIEAETFAAGVGLSISVVRSIPSLLNLARREMGRYVNVGHF